MNKSNKKNAIIISSDLVQDHEFIYPYYRLLEEDFKIEVCMLDGKPGNGYFGIPIPPNKDQKVISPEELDYSLYDLLILPGGVKSMEKVRLNKRIIEFIANFQKKETNIVASICSAAQLLISAKIINGKKISGYYSMKDDINNAGAIYTDELAVIDGNIITTAHYKDLGPWMKAVLAQYKKFNL